MLEGHEFVSAWFTNNDKTIIRSMWSDADGTVRPFTVTTDGPRYKELLEYISEDDLYENTVAKIRMDRERFESVVVNIATGDGINVDDILADEAKTVDFIFNWLDKEFNDEQLFKVKLRLFERDKVSNNENRALKGQLRKATTIKEVMEAYSNF
jgi:hypothetical protein